HSWPPELVLRDCFLPGWAPVDLRIGRTGGRQALGCWHAAGIADLGWHCLISRGSQMDCRRGGDHRLRAVAGLARAVVGGDRRSRGEGESGGQETMNPDREELLFQLALTKPAAERAAWLDRECGDDKDLRPRLVALLVAH